jgi:hypothetical protein
MLTCSSKRDAIAFVSLMIATAGDNDAAIAKKC